MSQRWRRRALDWCCGLVYFWPLLGYLALVNDSPEAVVAVVIGGAANFCLGEYLYVSLMRDRGAPTLT